MGNIRDYLYYDCGNMPSEKDITDLIKDVCSCMNEKDYLFSDLSLKQLKTLVVSNSIQATDTKGNHIEEMEMLLREHYNPKMLSKAIDNAEIVILSYSDIAGNPINSILSKNQIKQLLNL
jgi:hypothetical protein